jgi:ABC-type proline/glycine betaine transport system ATPase subunit
VLFATHYLAEAEEFADRVVLLRDGRVVADGTVAQVRALAAGRVVSATVANPAGLATLPGVSGVRVEGSRIQVLPAAMVAVAQFLPSYWIVAEAMGQAFGAGIDVQGVLVMLAWLVVVGALVAMRYRHDALRV